MSDTNTSPPPPRTTRYGRTLKKPKFLSPEPIITSSSSSIQKSKSPSTRTPTPQQPHVGTPTKGNKRPYHRRTPKKRKVVFAETTVTQLHGSDLDTDDENGANPTPIGGENRSNDNDNDNDASFSPTMTVSSPRDQHQKILHETSLRLRSLDTDYNRLDRCEKLLLMEYQRLRSEEVCLRKALRRSMESGKERRVRRKRKEREEVVSRLEAALFEDDDNDDDEDSDDNDGDDGGHLIMDGDCLLGGDGSDGGEPFLSLNI